MIGLTFAPLISGSTLKTGLAKQLYQVAKLIAANGTVQGNGRIGGEVSISSDAQWEGDVNANCAVIAGTVIGNVTVDDKLEVGASARLRGSVTARRIAIALGAQIEGEVVCTGAEPIVEFEEKRAAVPEE